MDEAERDALNREMEREREIEREKEMEESDIPEVPLFSHTEERLLFILFVCLSFIYYLFGSFLFSFKSLFSLPFSFPLSPSTSCDDDQRLSEMGHGNWDKEPEPTKKESVNAIITSKNIQSAIQSLLSATQEKGKEVFPPFLLPFSPSSFFLLIFVVRVHNNKKKELVPTLILSFSGL